MENTGTKYNHWCVIWHTTEYYFNVLKYMLGEAFGYPDTERWVDNKWLIVECKNLSPNNRSFIWHAFIELENAIEYTELHRITQNF